MNILIKNGNVIDGSGQKAYKADVLLSNGKIKAIGSGLQKEADCKVIDAEGLYVCPGFIDYHSHVDMDLFKKPSVESKLLQGVTTDVAGMCGLTFAPMSEKYYETFVNSMKFAFTDDETYERCKRIRSFDDLFSEYEKLEIGTNVALYIGQGTLRCSVMGMQQGRANQTQLDEMKTLVAQSMQAGALGLSAGLIYPTGLFAQKEELIELCKVVSEYNGSYAVHMRSESDDVIDSVRESIDIGRQSGVKVIISHHKIAGKENWGKSKETLKLIAEANDEGREVVLDQYPYTASATNLKTTIPPMYSGMDSSELKKLLNSVNGRKQVKKEILDFSKSWGNQVKNAGMGGIMIISCKTYPEINGKNITEISGLWGMDDDFDTLFKILADDNFVTMAAFYTMCEEDVKRIMQYEKTSIGSDGAIMLKEGSGHPRTTATYPRVLGRYVRELGVITLEEAVKKMTSMPANTAGLKSKGIIKVGYDADITIFNKDTVIDNATFLNIEKKNQGIEHVIVGGEISVENGKFTGKCAGKIIRRQYN